MKCTFSLRRHMHLVDIFHWTDYIRHTVRYLSIVIEVYKYKYLTKYKQLVHFKISTCCWSVTNDKWYPGKSSFEFDYEKIILKIPSAQKKPQIVVLPSMCIYYMHILFYNLPVSLKINKILNNKTLIEVSKSSLRNQP